MTSPPLQPALALPAPAPAPAPAPGACAGAPARRGASRWVAAVLLLVTGGLLGVSVWLRPDPFGTGMGTHTQLRLAPCAFQQMLGLPCATCGMTTAFAYAAHGRLLQAAVTQPAGAALALCNAALLLVSAYALATGCSLAPLGRWLGRPRVLLLLAGLVLGAWAYKLAVVYRTL